MRVRAFDSLLYAINGFLKTLLSNSIRYKNVFISQTKVSFTNFQIFEGNWDSSTVVKNAILRPFKTQTLKFHIDRCKSEQCCMRVEIYGPGKY